MMIVTNALEEDVEVVFNTEDVEAVISDSFLINVVDTWSLWWGSTTWQQFASQIQEAELLSGVSQNEADGKK